MSEINYQTILLASNINPADNGVMIIEGNQRVVNARLEDAAFFGKEILISFKIILSS